MLNLVLFGPPGAGKGTQANLLIDRYCLIHLSTGDILRGEIAEGTPLGLEAKQLMDNGLLVPDEVVIGMISSKLDKNPDAKGFIFDGFPRTINQAKGLDLLLDESQKIQFVLRIKVDEDDIIKRLIDRGRSDDKPEIIKNRFKSYNSETQPLIPFYEERKILFNINGMQQIEKVFEDIKKVIGI